MSVDESITLTLYALAYDTDKTAQLTHLKAARRCWKKSINSIKDDLSKKEAEKQYSSHPVLKAGRKKITAQSSGYDTDKDITEEPKEAATIGAPLRTKDVRGAGKKTIAREWELQFADNLYKKDEKKTGHAGSFASLYRFKI